MFRTGAYFSFCMCCIKDESILVVELFQCEVEEESSEAHASEERISLF